MQYLPTEFLEQDTNEMSFKAQDKKLDNWGLFDVLSSHRRELMENYENLARKVAEGSEVKATKVLNLFHSLVEVEKMVVASRSYHSENYKNTKIVFEESE